ncbi:MAG TPA: hypothetical protein VN785_12310 [Candidatus Angelobacter sp.]|nr:hypothetical protein [Candidatus Angelobacter sp.]
MRVKVSIIVVVALIAAALWFWGKKSGGRMRIVEKFKPWYPEK